MKINSTSIWGLCLSLVMLTGCSESDNSDGSDNPDNGGETIMSVMLQGKRGEYKHEYIMGELQPFLNSPLDVPSSYHGTTFDLRHDYPTSSAQTDQPWKEVTNNGPITTANAMEYVEALKEYVTPDMKKLLYDYDNWNSQEENWWQSIWLGTQREPIHGMYVGSPFPKGTLTPAQTTNLTTYVLTLYDETAAVTLNNIWGTDLEGAEKPNLSDVSKTQYAEGSVIVKFAFVTASGDDFAPMEGTATWPIYSNVDPATGSPYTEPDTVMRDVYMMQFDIIVKDSEAAPETGWVFSTLTYDKDAPGSDAWDKMTPLGATWGGDPSIIDTSQTALVPPVTVNQNLAQNWINMATPDYARSTLGWDGRLSGPNDGAVITGLPTQNGETWPNGIATVGCLGCHSTAQYTMEHMLVPIDDGKIYNPGESEWMLYFQSRAGDVPMDAGQIALDYDMVTSFKAIPLWQKAMKDALQQTADNADDQ